MSVAWMGLLAAAVFGVVIAAAVQIGYGWLRPLFDRLPAGLRGRLMFGLLLAPAGLGVALSLLAVLPGVAAAFAPGLDHCTQHDDHHFHLCLVHGPAGIDLGRVWMVLGLVATPPAIRAVQVVARVLRGRRLLAALRRLARPATATYTEVAYEAPFAFTAGLWHPRIYVTSGLLQLLDDKSRAAVLAHEAAHARRRDPLMKLLAEFAGAFHFPGARRALLADLALACEQACDEEAAVSIGDRTAVADALVRLGRVMAVEFPVRATAMARFGEGRISARVHALLDAPKPRPRLPSTGAVLALAVVLATLLSAPVHHATETVLGTLLG